MLKLLQIRKAIYVVLGTTLIIFLLLIVPVAATVIADLDLVSTKHEYGPGLPGIESKETTISLPTTGWLTITYQTDPYPGHMRGGPDFYQKDMKNYYLGQPGDNIYTPPEWVKGQPGKRVTKM